MSDARTEAIHKAATELVQELLSASSENGGERWFHIIVRKMERIPDRCPPKPPNTKLPLVLGDTRFDHIARGVAISSTQRDVNHFKGVLLPEKSDEVTFIPESDVTKLKLWLNGE